MNTTDKIGEFLQKGVDEGVFSGAQAAWCAGGKPEVESVSAGLAGDGSKTRIEPSTLFDIASVTKVFTASSALRLVEKGRLGLSASLAHHLRDSKETGLGAATLTELLAHEAGFASWLPLFETVPMTSRGTPEAKEAIIESALKAPPDSHPGTRALYSDLGYIVLFKLMETALDVRFERIIEGEVLLPLGLKSVCFRSVSPEGNTSSRREFAGRAKKFAATEQCPWRGRLLMGEVHDDNAWSMGGVSGHAGLFATAEDVARLGAAWLKALASGEWISKSLAARAVARRPLGRALGWDLKDPGQSSAGTLMGPDSFGHLGFTGCSLWVDPDAGVSVALNTNRVIFGRDNLKIRDFRPRFHDMLVEECGGSTSR